jgi:four helix bundle protein
MVYRSFEELDVWKRSCLLAVGVYEAVKNCSDCGLKDQMQRASVSIASNIAEGCERGGKDFSRFLRIAQGSSAELRTQLYIAKKIRLFDDEKLSELIAETKEIAKMLTGLRKSLSRRVESPKK